MQNLSSFEKYNSSTSNGNQLLPPPVLKPSSNIDSTHAPISHERDVKKTMDEKDLYQWEDTSEINPINEIVEFHTIDENETKLDSKKSNHERPTMTNVEAEYDTDTNNQLTTQSNIDTNFDLITKSGNPI